MKKKGFTFIECVLAIGILSIIGITILPVLETSLKQYSSITINNDLRNIAQSTIEILKSNDSLSVEWLEELEEKDYMEVEANYIKNDYKCSITRIYNSKFLVEVEVSAWIYKDKDVGEVVLKASIRK